MLDSILRNIDLVYGLDLQIDVQDFLVNEATCARMGGEPGRGMVLVKQRSQDELELGLYLTEDQLERLTEVDLGSSLAPPELELLLVAIEEVSHLAYLVFCASREKRVTVLELELQAEVDKFVTFTLLHASRNDGRVPANLLDRLFGDFEIRPGLDPEGRERYSAASSLASRYCSYFVQTALRREEGLAPLLPELRRFYRLSQSGKIGRIQNFVMSGISS